MHVCVHVTVTLCCVAAQARDALSKALYDRTFSQVALELNQRMAASGGESAAHNSRQVEFDNANAPIIGIDAHGCGAASRRLNRRVRRRKASQPSN